MVTPTEDPRQWERWVERSACVNTARQPRSFRIKVFTCQKPLYGWLTRDAQYESLVSRVRAGEDKISFDKDDDDTLDFVTAASSLRSAAYYIERKTRWEVKGAFSRI